MWPRQAESSQAKSIPVNLSISRMLVEELLGFVDLGGQVRAAPTIGVIEQHELTVLLAHLILVQSTLTANIFILVSRSECGC